MAPLEVAPLAGEGGPPPAPAVPFVQALPPFPALPPLFDPTAGTEAPGDPGPIMEGEVVDPPSPPVDEVAPSRQFCAPLRPPEKMSLGDCPPGAPPDQFAVAVLPGAPA